LYDDTKGRNDFLLRHWSHFAVQNDIHMKSSYRITNHPHPQTADHVATKGHIDAGDHLIQDIRAYYSFEQSDAPFKDVIHSCDGPDSVTDIERTTNVVQVGKGAAKFKSADKEITIGKALHTHNKDFTVSMWVRLPNVSSEQTLMQSNKKTENKAWRLQTQSDGKLRFQVFSNSSNAKLSDSTDHYAPLIESSKSISTPNRWYFVTLRRHLRQVSLYVDNEQVANDNLFLEENEDITENNIWKSYFTSANQEVSTLSAKNNGLAANAHLGAVGVWDRALDRAEIHYLYNHGQGTDRFLDKLWHIFPAHQHVDMKSFQIQDVAEPTEDHHAARLADIKKWCQGNLDVRQTVAQGPTDVNGHASFLSVAGGRHTVDTGRRTNNLAQSLRSYFTFDKIDNTDVFDLVDDSTATAQDDTGTLPTVVGLRAYYDFEGDVKDRHGSNDGSKENGASFGTGVFGGEAVKFSNGDQYVDVGSAFDFAGGDFSVAFWFEPENVGTEQVLLTTHTASSLNNRHNYFDVVLNGSNYLELRAKGGSAEDEQTAVASPATPLQTGNGFYYIVVTRRGQAYGLYLDNQSEITSDGILTAGDISKGNKGTISAQTSGILSSGLIDELGAWSRVLTSDERSTLYNDGNGRRYGDTPKLITGNSLQFPGDGSHVELGDRLNVGKQDFFISFWARADSAISSSLNVITNAPGTDPLNASGQMRIQFDGNASPNAIVFEVYDSSYQTITYDNGGNGVTFQDVWHLVQVDRTDKTYNLYVDGINVGSTTTTNDVDVTNNAELTDGNFNGSIDELGVWTRPSTVDDRALLYDDTLQRNLRTFYALDGNTNDAENGNNGSATTSVTVYDSGGIEGKALKGNSTFTTTDTAWPDGKTSNVSLMFWWKPANLGNYTTTIVESTSSDDTFDNLSINSKIPFWGNNAFIQVKIGSSTVNFASSNPISVGDWHQIAWVYDIHEGQSRLFVNGFQEDEERDFFDAPNFGVNSKLVFFPSDGNVDADDLLDQVQTYTSTLSKWEVYLAYNQGQSLSYNELSEADIVNLGSPAAFYELQNSPDDATPNGNDGTFTDNASFAGGFYRNALQGGSSDFSTSSNTWPVNGTAGSFIFWAKLSLPSSGEKELLDGGDNFSVKVNSSGKVSLDGQDNTNVYTIESADNIVGEDKWHQIAGMVDNDNNELALYVDGQQVGTQLMQGEVSFSVPLTFKTGTSTPYEMLDEVSLYSRVLSKFDVLAAYNDGDGLSYVEATNDLESDLLAFYPLDSSSGPNDLTGAGNDGAFGTGTTTYTTGLQDPNSALKGDTHPFFVATDAWPSNSSDRSFISWFSFSSLPTSGTVTLADSTISNPSGGGDGNFLVEIDSNGKVILRLTDGSGDDRFSTESGNSAVEGDMQWHQIAAAIDSTNNNVTLYVDTNASSTSVSTDDVEFGSVLKFHAEDSRIAGLDQVSIYGRVLSDADIITAYDFGNGLTYTETINESVNGINLASNVLAFYALDDTPDDKVNGNPSGTVSSLDYTTGLRGSNALSGKAEFITADEAWPDGDTTDASFIAWWKPSNLEQDATFVENTGSGAVEFRVVLRERTKLELQTKTGSEFRTKISFDTMDTTWHQIAVTFANSSNSGRIALYLDGNQVGTHNPNNKLDFGSSSQLVFFPNQNVKDNDKLDHVVTYNRVLSEYDIRLHYNNGSPLLYSELSDADDIACYPDDFVVHRPMQFMFGDGFDDGFQLNKGVETSSLLSWTGFVTPSDANTFPPHGTVRTHYLFVEYDETNGELTTGHTTNAPTYSYHRPLGGSGPQQLGGTASNSHWYPLDHRNRMQYYDQQNSTWKEDTLRLFVGEADVNDQGHVIATRTYAYQGRFFSQFRQGVGKGFLAFHHNMGTKRCRTTFIGKVRNPGGGSPVLKDFSSDDEIVFNGTHNAAYVTYNESSGNRAILASNGNTIGNFTPTNGGTSEGDPNFSEFDFACEVVRAF
jgi:tellurite resistance-related uncharacterized protein